MSHAHHRCRPSRGRPIIGKDNLAQRGILPYSRRLPTAERGGGLIGRKSGPRQAYSLTLTTSILAVLALDCLFTIFGFPVSRYSVMYYPGGGWWTLFTYPLAADPLELVLAGFWLYLAGNDIEARWGRLRYGLFLAISVPLCSLPLFLGAAVFHRPIILAGPFLPLACLTVAWCVGRLDGLVLLGFLLPIPTRVLLILEFILVFIFSAMVMPPLLALLALAGPGLSYLYARRVGPDAKILSAIRRSKEKHNPTRQPRRRKRLRVIKP